MSITTRIDPVDPLQLLSGCSQTVRYWEQPLAGLAMAGLGSAWALPTGGVITPYALRSLYALWRDAIVVSDSDDGSGPLLIGGFAFDPLSPPRDVWVQAGDPWLEIPRLLVVRKGEDASVTVSLMAHEVFDGEGLEEELRELTALRAASHCRTIPPPEVLKVTNLPGRATWRSMLMAALSEIATGNLEKVVIARREDIDFAHAVDVVSVLDRLRRDYPDTTTFATGDGTACFVGATPEPLVTVVGGRARVPCLAGSKPRGVDERDDAEQASSLLEDDKNLREHAAVVRSVTDTMRPLCSELHVDESPSIMTVRNIHHLRTSVEGSLSDGNTTVIDLAMALNPTPATAGTPQTRSLTFIRVHEPFDRGLYAGGVGWMNARGEGEFAVGIRSALLRGKTAHLYAGCGIVAASDPDTEWQETELKLSPLRSALLGS